MASIYLGLNRGQMNAQPELVLEGSSTQSTDIELRIDTGKGTLRAEAKMITDVILRYLLDGRSAFFPE
jgi:hypothetical protein